MLKILSGISLNFYLLCFSVYLFALCSRLATCLTEFLIECSIRVFYYKVTVLLESIYLRSYVQCSILLLRKCSLAGKLVMSSYITTESSEMCTAVLYVCVICSYTIYSNSNVCYFSRQDVTLNKERRHYRWYMLFSCHSMRPSDQPTLLLITTID